MKLGLGTVHFGFEGGHHHAESRVTLEEIRRILEIARHAGISLLDTSAQAGRSEELLGQCLPDFPEFRIMSRAPVFETRQIGSHQADQVENALQATLDTLQREKLYALLIQHPGDLLAEHGERLPKRMQVLQQKGLVDKIGVSVSGAAELEKVLRIFEPDIVQLPLSVLDQRLLKSGHLALLKQKGIEVHARSIFLQGVLLEPTHPHPWFWPIRKLLEEYNEYLVQTGLTPLEGALSFVRCIPQVDCALVGVSSARHLQEIVDAYEMSASDCDFTRFAVSEEKYVNPALWNLYA